MTVIKMSMEPCAEKLFLESELVNLDKLIQKEKKIMEAGRENTQGLINKELLLD